MKRNDATNVGASGLPSSKRLLVEAFPYPRRFPLRDRSSRTRTVYGEVVNRSCNRVRKDTVAWPMCSFDPVRELLSDLEAEKTVNRTSPGSWCHAGFVAGGMILGSNSSLKSPLELSPPASLNGLSLHTGLTEPRMILVVDSVSLQRSMALACVVSPDSTNDTRTNALGASALFVWRPVARSTLPPEVL